LRALFALIRGISSRHTLDPELIRGTMVIYDLEDAGHVVIAV
jgi:hypothetical protein